MDSFVALLKKIESNPKLFLGEKDLRRLRFFISGYLMCEGDNGKTGSLTLMEAFYSYFESIYGIRSYYHCTDVLRQECGSEEEAFDKFFELFNAFLDSESNKE